MEAIQFRLLSWCYMWSRPHYICSLFCIDCSRSRCLWSSLQVKRNTSRIQESFCQLSSKKAKTLSEHVLLSEAYNAWHARRYVGASIRYYCERVELIMCEYSKEMCADPKHIIIGYKVHRIDRSW
jgi:hypothetical protein